MKTNPGYLAVFGFVVLLLLGGGCANASRNDSASVSTPAAVDQAEFNVAGDEEKVRSFIPDDGFDVKIQSFDFNNDGVNEYVTYAKENIVFEGKSIEKQFIKVLRADASGNLTVDHEDEGADPGNISIEKDFLSFVNIDTDPEEEVRITKDIDGTGAYRLSYFLVWDGQKVTELFLPQENTVIADYDLNSYLGPGESFGVMHMFASGKNTIAICQQRTQCEYRDSPPDALGEIQFDAIYKNGWQLTNFKRI